MTESFLVSSNPGEPLERSEAERLADVFRAISNPARLLIVSLLAGATGEVASMDFIGPLGLSQPTVSHHIGVLEKAGLIQTRRQGVYRFHTLNLDRFAEMVEAIQRAASPKPSRRRRR